MAYRGTKIKRLAKVDEEICEFLNKNTGFYTSFFIAKRMKTKITNQTLTKYLKDLCKNNRIKSYKVGNGEAYGR